MNPLNLSGHIVLELYCIVFYCIVLYCVVVYCTVKVTFSQKNIKNNKIRANRATNALSGRNQPHEPFEFERPYCFGIVLYFIVFYSIVLY